MCQNLVPLVNIKIAGKWMFIPLKIVLIGIDPYPYGQLLHKPSQLTTASAALQVVAKGSDEATEALQLELGWFEAISNIIYYNII